MEHGNRTAVYDQELHLEACRFRAYEQPFPSHFHEYYVIGLVEAGERVLTCRNREYAIREGSVLLFNPGDSHGCVQTGGGSLDYRGLHVPLETMLDLTESFTGRRELPGFSQCVLEDPETACAFRRLHREVMGGSLALDREEALLGLLTLLFRQYGRAFAGELPACREEVQRACEFMEAHCGERLTLEGICRAAGLSKSALLRAFVRERGVTPCRWLESARIGEARRLLEQGVPTAEAALRTGFSDQSHFTHRFTRLLGLPPGAYREIFRGAEREPHI